MGIPDHERDRLDALAWAAEVAADPRAVYLDTETTGLRPGSDVVEIAVIDATGAPLIDTLVRPRNPIPPDAAAIHGISNEMVADAPTWPEVFPDLQRVLEGRRVIVYNAAYDWSIVDALVDIHGLPPLTGGWQCAMEIYAVVHGEWNSRTGNYRWQQLNLAAKRFQHNPGGHRAMADAEVCRLVVQSLAEMYRAEIG